MRIQYFNREKGTCVLTLPDSCDGVPDSSGFVCGVQPDRMKREMSITKMMSRLRILLARVKECNCMAGSS